MARIRRAEPDALTAWPRRSAERVGIKEDTLVRIGSETSPSTGEERLFSGPFGLPRREIRAYGARQTAVLGGSRCLIRGDQGVNRTLVGAAVATALVLVLPFAGGAGPSFLSPASAQGNGDRPVAASASTSSTSSVASSVFIGPQNTVVADVISKPVSDQGHRARRAAAPAQAEAEGGRHGRRTGSRNRGRAALPSSHPEGPARPMSAGRPVQRRARCRPGVCTAPPPLISRRSPAPTTRSASPTA